MAIQQLQLYGQSARQIRPAVVNLFQNNNKVDSLEFQMENYNQDNVDLSTMDAYAIVYSSLGLDEIKLESEVTEDGLLRVYWDLNSYTLALGEKLTYQIVFKADDGSSWTSYKAILFSNESLTADEEIVCDYPTILYQIEKNIETKTEEATQGAVEEITGTVADTVNNAMDQINNIAGNFDAGVIYIPFGEHIPVEMRIYNRLYYQYTNAENTKGCFEDYMGNVLVAEGSGGGGGSSLPMFAPIWSDHLYNDASYLRADNFSWHNADIYVTGYNELLKEYNNENCVEETENGVTYKRSPNGFKIASVDQHDNVRLAYEDNGKSWFYLLDVENARFKLPREKKTDGKYLYFYLGYYERPETEVNIGILTELANGTDMSVIDDEINVAKDTAIAEVSASTMLADLQTQIDSLKAEINTMLGRMDFANSEMFELDGGDSYVCSSDGYIQFISGSSNEVSVLINGKHYCRTKDVYEGRVLILPVSFEDTISISGGSLKGTFIPQKGV